MFEQIVDAKIDDLHFKYDEASGLKAIIAIHSTRRGPALGGCRIVPYHSSQDALTDAIRLAKGMSYKAALAGLALGGGKAVILEPAKPYQRQALFNAFGRFVDELGGRYITAMDSGTTLADMDTIATQTRHVTCTSAIGNPAPYTAMGVFQGIKACLKAHPDLSDSLKGVRVAVQGLGNVGYTVCQLLHQEGAQLWVSDLDDQRVAHCVKAFGAVGVPCHEILATPCEILSPCGLGGILDEPTVQQLQCAAVAGAANNQLLNPACGLALYRRGILYAPDYLVNAGGLIFVSMKYHQASDDAITQRITGIYDTLLDIFRRTQQDSKPSHVLVDHRAEALLFAD